MARTNITPEKIKEINELYLEIKTYSGVSRALNGIPSPTTVKKYIIPDYVSEKELGKLQKKFKIEDLPEFDSEKFICEEWGDLCVLSDEEKEEVKDLWKELSL